MFDNVMIKIKIILGIFLTAILIHTFSVYIVAQDIYTLKSDLKTAHTNDDKLKSLIKLTK